MLKNASISVPPLWFVKYEMVEFTYKDSVKCWG